MPLRDRLVDVLMDSFAVRSALATSPLALAIGEEEALGLVLDVTPVLGAVLAVDDLQYTEQGPESALALANVGLSALPGGAKILVGIIEALSARDIRVAARDSVNATMPPPRLVQLTDEGVVSVMTGQGRRLANEAGGPFAALTDEQAPSCTSIAGAQSTCSC